MLDLGVLDTIEAAIGLLDESRIRSLWSHHDRAVSHPQTPRVRFAWGLWFRGAGRHDWDLAPHAFRHGQGAVNAGWEETNIFHHFQLRLPQERATHRSDFEWLCLMQHYGVPTRLLDWSESILVALFFAVWDEADDAFDGALYLLNAARMNAMSQVTASLDRMGIEVPNGADCVLRSAMAKSRVRQRWEAHVRAKRYDPELWDLDEVVTRLSNPSDNDMHERLSRPVAVYPHRLNGRMIAQSSTFTLHGGKRYAHEREVRCGPQASNLLDPPTSIESLDAAAGRTRGQEFLGRAFIPAARKRPLREKLAALAIHRGALFPDVEGQGQYVGHQWNSASIPAGRDDD